MLRRWLGNDRAGKELDGREAGESEYCRLRNVHKRME